MAGIWNVGGVFQLQTAPASHMLGPSRQHLTPFMSPRDPPARTHVTRPLWLCSSPGSVDRLNTTQSGVRESLLVSLCQPQAESYERRLARDIMRSSHWDSVMVIAGLWYG